MYKILDLNLVQKTKTNGLFIIKTYPHKIFIY